MSMSFTKFYTWSDWSFERSWSDWSCSSNQLQARGL